MLSAYSRFCEFIYINIWGNIKAILTLLSRAFTGELVLNFPAMCMFKRNIEPFIEVSRVFIWGN